MALCGVDDCGGEVRARGWCNRHYLRWKAHGDPTITLKPRDRRCTIVGCDEPHKARGWCRTHYERWQRTGDPMLVRPPGQSASPLAERFWAKVDRSSDGCWEWTGGRFDEGYGTIRVAGRSLKTHRVAWELVQGAIPEGLCVCHRCDNPPCCRPDHLFLGTREENNRDRDEKGRGARRP